MRTKQIGRSITLVPPLKATQPLDDLLSIHGPLLKDDERILGDISNWSKAEIDGAEDRLRALFPEFFRPAKNIGRS